VKLILASGSPRRRELLTQAGFLFEVIPADIDETRHPNEAPKDYVRRLALEKAEAIAPRYPDATILGADTTVVLSGEVMNKPTDLADAERMLRALSNKTHQVYTGLAVVTPTAKHSHIETTNVVFREISEDELATYLASGHAQDKAGAYGIQGYAARWIPRIEGDYFNVVGLPLSTVVKLLSQ